MKNVDIELLPGGRLPVRATSGAAAMDVYARLDRGHLILHPGERDKVPLGFRVALPRNHELQIRPRSGLALREGLTILNSPGTIDSDYRGEVAALVINHGDMPVIINKDDRIAQAVICELPLVSLSQVDSLSQTERGEGGFGHTGKR